jgi:hypothetical protein
MFALELHGWRVTGIGEDLTPPSAEDLQVGSTDEAAASVAERACPGAELILGEAAERYPNGSST